MIDWKKQIERWKSASKSGLDLKKIETVESAISDLDQEIRARIEEIHSLQEPVDPSAEIADLIVRLDTQLAEMYDRRNALAGFLDWLKKKLSLQNTA